MTFDAEIHLGDIILMIITAVVIPIIRGLAGTIYKLDSSVNGLSTTLTFMSKEHDDMKEDIKEQRDWLIAIKDRRQP